MSIKPEILFNALGSNEPTEISANFQIVTLQAKHFKIMLP